MMQASLACMAVSRGALHCPVRSLRPRRYGVVHADDRSMRGARGIASSNGQLVLVAGIHCKLLPASARRRQNVRGGAWPAVLPVASGHDSGILLA